MNRRLHEGVLRNEEVDLLALGLGRNLMDCSLLQMLDGYQS